MKQNNCKNNLDKKLLSNNENIVIDALMYLCFNIEDFEWIQKKCIQMIKTGKTNEVKGLALTCIGHIARQYAKIDRKLVMPVLHEMLNDPSLSGRAEDALDDINIFVKDGWAG
jgi:hypothetical protein